MFSLGIMDDIPTGSFRASTLTSYGDDNSVGWIRARDSVGLCYKNSEKRDPGWSVHIFEVGFVGVGSSSWREGGSFLEEVKPPPPPHQLALKTGSLARGTWWGGAQVGVRVG